MFARDESLGNLLRARGRGERERERVRRKLCREEQAARPVNVDLLVLFVCATARLDVKSPFFNQLCRVTVKIAASPYNVYVS
jgi:hypothetical protein